MWQQGFEPVLGNDHGAAVAGELQTRRQDGFRPFRVELGSGLVQCHELRPRGQNRGQLDALPLAAGEGRQASAAEVLDRE